MVRDGTTNPHPAEAARVSQVCHRVGVVTLTCGTSGSVLRLLPPLVISDDLLSDALAVLTDALSSR